MAPVVTGRGAAARRVGTRTMAPWGFPAWRVAVPAEPPARERRALTLRRRLTLLVALTIVVPVTAVAVTVVNLMGADRSERTMDRLQQATAVVEATLRQDRADIDRVVSALARDPRLEAGVVEGGEGLDRALRQVLGDDDLDVLVVTAPSGSVVATARRPGRFAPGAEVPGDGALASGDGGGRAQLAAAVRTGGGAVVGGRWLDSARLELVPRTDDVTLALVAGRDLVATTAEVGKLPARSLEGSFTARFGGQRRVADARPVPGSGVTAVALAALPGAGGSSNLILLFGVLILVIVVLIVLVGWVVSGVVTGPVDDLVEAALAVSRGDLSQRVDVSGDVELATLGRAFNRMTDNLREYVAQLEESRHQFRSAMARLGDVLVSTHDLEGIIDVVLEACTLTLGAERAVFYDRVALPARIRAQAAYGGDVPDLELNGTGLAGTAARSGPVLHPGGPGLDPGEPQVESALAVPVVVDNRLEAVLALYGRDGGGVFDDDDLGTLQTLGRQAEVAIGNVYLHRQTQNQARTDGTTGLWNRREFELRSREAVLEASRFGDPFGVILVDIDDFKKVNDLHGHPTGDAALIWVASRLSEATRDIDIVARWGGEEFTVLLPRAGREETRKVAERVREGIAAGPMIEGDNVIALTVSIGFACHPQDGTTADDLFGVADRALLRAKRLGKNRVEPGRPISEVEV